MKLGPFPRLGNVTPQELCAIIAQARCNLSDETKTQADLHKHICDALPGVASGIIREVRLTSRDRVDIWANGVVIEVKLMGAKVTSIYRQVKRYAEHPEVQAIIVAANKAISLPREIEGKPTFVCNLGKAWL